VISDVLGSVFDPIPLGSLPLSGTKTILVHLVWHKVLCHVKDLVISSRELPHAQLFKEQVVRNEARDRRHFKETDIDLIR